MDGHVHTLACFHAYNSVLELVHEAAEKNLELICITEHGPTLPEAPQAMFFANYKVIPAKIRGVSILKGIEANITDHKGTIDVPKGLEERMEIISASLHPPVIKPATKKKNTAAVIGAIENPLVDFICHLGNPQYELDYEAILQAAKAHDTMIEINNSSAYVRKGSAGNCIAIARRCAELEIPIILGSDTHFCTDVGNFIYADKVLDLAEVPDELIVNLETRRLLDYLRAKGKLIFTDFRAEADAELL